MKIIFNIARNEFRYLFYSPIAWFLILVFFVQATTFFIDPIINGTIEQDILMKNSPDFKDFGDIPFTINIFLRRGIFQNAMQNLFLFIPLLTMGLVSREINNGTIKLLYSSPVNLRRIVFGKYLGIMLFNLLLIFILGIFMITGVLIIKHVDYGLLLSATLGFYLLMCAYSAIGLFMSSLSSYQIVSALSSFAIIFVLSRIGDLWQRYDLVRDLTYFLSLQNRTGKMLLGLITTKDVIYFLVVTGMFVGFTLIRLRGGREARPWYVQSARYMVVTMSALVIGYISSRPMLTGYLDATATRMNTIHPKTQEIIKELGDSTLEVTLYTNLLDAGSLGRGLPENRNADYLSNMWDPYLRFKPDIQFKYEYYYDNDINSTDSVLYKQFPGKTLQQIAGESADAVDAELSDFKTPNEMHQSIDLKPEGYRLVMRLKYQGRTAFLRTFDDPFFWPDETNVNAAIKRLTQAKMPELTFVSGELERDIFKTGIREYAFHTSSKAGRGALVNIGFDVDTVNLTTQDVSTGVTALVLADPKTDLSPAVLNKLKNYITLGGNVFIAGEPGKQNVLNPVLQQLGVQLLKGQLVQPSYDETPDKILPYLTAASSDLSESMSWIKKEFNGKEAENPIKPMMPGTSGISYSPDSRFTIKPLAMTLPDKVWLKAGSLVIDSTLPPFNPGAGDIKEHSFPTILQLTRKISNKEQRMIISADADFASNSRIGYNAYFLMPLYSWLAYSQFPVYTPRPPHKDNLFKINGSQASVLSTMFVWVFPSLVLLSGIILLIRRKRK